MVWSVYIKNKEEFDSILKENLVGFKRYEGELTDCMNAEQLTEMYIDGYCEVCGSESKFKIDYLCSDGKCVNFRERCVCERCNFNTRMRYMLATIRQEYSPGKKIYMQEAVTKLYKETLKYVGAENIIGSEYMGEQYKSGDYVNGVLHQDIMDVSFSDNSFDLIVSCDVFEHVANYKKGLSECSRILKTGGKMIMSVPFHSNKKETQIRCEIVDGELIHHQKPEYHLNPISSEGSLVFTDFGWDFFEDIKKAGFSEVYMKIYYSKQCVYIGGIPFVIEAIK